MDTAATGSQAGDTEAPAPLVNEFPGKISYNPNWKTAKRNQTVYIWQNSLWSRVYKWLKRDGVYGPMTLRAVVDWQTRRPQARNVNDLCDRNMWHDLVQNTRPYESGPCGSRLPNGSPLCMGKCQMPPAASAQDEEEVDLDELVEMYDLESLIANYVPNGDNER